MKSEWYYTGAPPRADKKQAPGLNRLICPGCSRSIWVTKRGLFSSHWASTGEQAVAGDRRIKIYKKCSWSGQVAPESGS